MGWGVKFRGRFPEAGGRWIFVERFGTEVGKGSGWISRWWGQDGLGGGLKRGKGF
jgi:hypothetical protein